MDTKALIEIAEYLKSGSVANELRKLDQRLQDSNVALTLPLVGDGEFSSGKPPPSFCIPALRETTASTMSRRYTDEDVRKYENENLEQI